MQRQATEEEIEKYHVQEIWEEDEVVGWKLILDENEEPIPLSTCLCFAREPTECVCMCTGWEDYRYD